MAVRESVQTPDICPACGTENNRDARSCASCREPLPPERQGNAPLESCTIALWRGYVSSSFFAASDDGTALVESKPFRSRGAGVPSDEGAAHRAYEQLLSALEADGWSSDGVEGDLWFATRLIRSAERRVVAAPPAAKARSKPRALKLDPPKPRPRRRPRLITMLFGAGLAITIGALLVGAAGYSAHRAKAAQQVVRTRPVTPVAVHTGAAPPAKPQAQKQPKVAAPALVASTTVRVSIAAKQISWLEIRDRSATGRVLYSGELAAGRQLHFKGTRLWGRFGAAGNLTITANGHPVTLLGTFEHVFVAPKR
jgi:hypothetical protein